MIGIGERADPGLTHEFVALMTHSDHIGMSSRTLGDRINNGTLDNAAGVAPLLEVARAPMAGRARPQNGKAKV